MKIKFNFLKILGVGGFSRPVYVDPEDGQISALTSDDSPAEEPFKGGKEKITTYHQYKSKSKGRKVYKKNRKEQYIVGVDPDAELEEDTYPGRRNKSVFVNEEDYKKAKNRRK